MTEIATCRSAEPTSPVAVNLNTLTEAVGEVCAAANELVVHLESACTPTPADVSAQAPSGPPGPGTSPLAESVRSLEAELRSRALGPLLRLSQRLEV